MRCFDGHCDTLARCMTTGEGLRQNGGHVDLARCAALGQHAQIFAVFADSSKTSAPLYTVAQRQHALLERECARNADLVRRCRTARDVRAAWAAGKTAALLGIEGAELLECDPRRLDDAAAWECVYVTLTWNHANALAGSHCDAQAQGLTAQGRDFVRALYAHQMLPDVSHLSEAAAWDVVRLGLGPVIASHANSRAVCAHTRNLSDDLFRAIRDSGGVVGLNLYTDFLGGGGMDAVVRHVEHLLDLGGGSGELAIGIGCRSLHLIEELLHGAGRRVGHARHGVACLGHATRDLGNVANHGFDLNEVGRQGVNGSLARLEQRLHLGKCRRKLVYGAIELCHHGLCLGECVVEVADCLVERVDDGAGLAQRERELDNSPHAGNGK